MKNMKGIVGGILVLTLLTLLVAEAQLVQSYGHTSKISALSFSPDSRRLVSGSCDPVDFGFDSHYLIVANIDRKTIEFLSAKNYNCSPLIILADNKTIFFEGEDNTVQYWDLSQGNFKGKAAGEWEDLLTVSPDGTHFVFKGEGNTVKVFDASNLQPTSTIPARSVIGFSPDGQRMISESFDRVIQIWNVREGTLIKSIDQIVYPYYKPPVVTNDLTYLATSQNQTTEIWDLNKGQIINRIPNMFSGQFEPTIALSPEGVFLAVATKQKIVVWGTFSGKLVHEFNVEDDLEVSKLVFSPNGKYLASASTSGRIETQGGQTKSSLQGKVHIWNLEAKDSGSKTIPENLTTIIQSSETIQIFKENGVYKVPCKINGLSLSFIIDTGASDVSISLTEALFMLKNGYLNETDIRGIKKYRIANGQIAEGTKVILRSVKIGRFEINDVEASVLHNINSPLLFGLSALQRFGKIEIDYNQMTLKLGQ
jgi:clan AA aspartic protease (TIGR02281 family)